MRPCQEPHFHAHTRDQGLSKRFVAKHAIRILAALALLAVIVAAQPGAAPAEPVAERWVSVRLASGSDEASSLDGRGYRQLPVPEGMTTEAYLAWLEDQPGIAGASYNPTVTAAGDPNDVFYASAQDPYLGSVDAPAAWDITTNAEEIVVAIIDSGIDLGHEDLKANLWQNPNDSDNDGVDDDNNGCIDDRYGCRFVNLTPKRISECGYTSSTPNGDVRDDDGTAESLGSHGTAVAGIIGARGNNRTGISGVAWRVRLMILKALDCGPGGTQPTGEMANVARAIDYARRMGADVINLSLASSPGNPAADIPELRQAIEDALADGLIIVAAAGNHAARGVGFPAAYAQYPNVIGVGASDPANDNAWADFSSFGGGVDVAAPGSGLASTIRSNLGASTPYGTLPGATSFAAPIVTGLFALVMARNPDLTMEEYIDIVQDSATEPAAADHGGNWAGHGVINMRAALERVPMTVSGSALDDWTRPPAGTPVRALVDGVECGATETENTNGNAAYSLRIAGENEIPGCGAPGREVRIIVGERPASAPLPWGALNESLARSGYTVNGIDPPPGPIVEQELGAGWNQVAYLGPSASLPAAAAALPQGWSAIAVWDPDAEGGGAFLLHYAEAPAQAQTLTELSRYQALWVYSDGGAVFDANPEPPPGRRVELAEGWNAIVYTGESRPVEAALASISGRYDQVLRYDNATGLWDSYLPGSAPQLNDFGGLHPYRVYWIRMTTAATLVMF